MSHLGMKILYALLNSLDYVWCERAFAPWVDMEEKLRENNIALFSLESKTPLSKFDFLGFTLQYELCYTNILNILELSKIPLHACERDEQFPIVIGGGPCACNPEPLADFFDLFVLGEGEEVTVKLVKLYNEMKSSGIYKKTLFLEQAAKIDGIYVPSFYNVIYNEDNTVCETKPIGNAPKSPKKRIIKDLDKAFYPKEFVVPFIDVIHDRVMQEIFRGCIRGCRFCQAGYIYRPVREKSAEVVNAQAKTLCETSGYDEISLSSLSTADYKELEPLIDNLTSWTTDKKINISLPSLRIDSVSKELLEKIKTVRTSGLTFAPEASTKRLRDVINKNLTEEEILSTCSDAFASGYLNVKLYFMIGLPTETMEDIKGIITLAEKVVNLFYQNPNRQRGKTPTVNVSVSTFVPKAFTPFQWSPQDDIKTMKEKQKYLVSCVTNRKIHVSWSDPYTSELEAAFARGDRHLGKVLETAFKMGCKLDGWGEYFAPTKWRKAFEENGLTEDFYATRTRNFDEILPWSHLDYGVDEKFLQNEMLLATKAETTPNCREHCSNCGITKFCGGGCDA